MCRDAWHWQQLNPNGYRGAGDEEAVPQLWRGVATHAAGARVQL